MLIYRNRRSGHANLAKSRAKQRGVTLLITLIVLVAMTMAAISLMRSVDTTNVIAGNLAFRQSAAASGDVGVEKAIAWLEQNIGVTLNTSQPASGYSASHQEPLAGQTWDQWWNQVVVARGFVSLPQNQLTGNTVSYTIDRMCATPGDPLSVGTNCSETSATVSTGSSQTSGSVSLTTSTQIYYRITSRTLGPRNTVSYVQSVIAL
jgi:type IV pilus assembly protein PilX